MLSGPPAAKKLTQEYSGVTLHRRNLVMANLVVDFHARLATQQLASSSFANVQFCQALGAELGSMEASVVEELVTSFVDRSKSQLEGRDLTQVPVMFQFHESSDHGMYKTIGKTKFFGLLRFMMSKYRILCFAGHTPSDILFRL